MHYRATMINNKKEYPMLWTIAVGLIILWILGMDADLTMGSFIHLLYAAAVALLVISLSQEDASSRMLRHISRNRGPKHRQTAKLTREQLTDPAIPTCPIR
jgi:hypothetical protein